MANEIVKGFSVNVGGGAVLVNNKRPNDDFGSDANADRPLQLGVTPIALFGIGYAFKCGWSTADAMALAVRRAVGARAPR